MTIKPVYIQDGIGLDESFSDVRVPDHLALSMTQAHFVDPTDENEDTLVRYKSAFILHLQKKTDECAAILNSLFPQNSSSLNTHDSIDSATLSIAERLIDEAPSADPRWGTSFRTEDQDIGMKSKILIKNFLVDKRESLELFVNFLSSMGIWSRVRRFEFKYFSKLCLNNIILHSWKE